MGDTYYWHPGSGALAPHWLLSLRLEADELLSSWIIRAAHKQDSSIFRFFSFYSTGGFFGDVDISVDAAVLRRLELASGLPFDAMRMAMLDPHISLMLDEASASGSITQWVLPIGLQPIKRVSGVQFCPKCWQADVDPYLRIGWRMAWHIACPIHRIMLQDRCGACDAIISPHFSRPFGSTMACCTKCMGNLKDSSVIVVSDRLLAFQMTCDQVLKRGSGEALGMSWTSNQWFLLQSVYVSAILRLSRVKPEMLMALLKSPLQEASRSGAGLRLELMRVSERAKLLELLEGVRGLSPSDTVELVRLSGRIPRSLRARLNDDLSSVLRLNETRPTIKRVIGPRPKIAVKAMMKRLKKKASQ